MAGVQGGSVSHSLCSSPQDTVVALQALAAFAALTAAHHDVTVKVNSDAVTTVATFYIHQGNQLLQQSQQVKELSWGRGVGCSTKTGHQDSNTLPQTLKVKVSLGCVCLFLDRSRGAAGPHSDGRRSRTRTRPGVVQTFSSAEPRLSLKTVFYSHLLNLEGLLSRFIAERPLLVSVAELPPSSFLLLLLS